MDPVSRYWTYKVDTGEMAGEDRHLLKRTILLFGGLSITILLLFQLSKLSVLGFEGLGDIWILLLGSLFVAMGFLLSRLISINNDKWKDLIGRNLTAKPSNLSKQEHRVLVLMADGLSNLEIAEKLFISESTVKSHVSKVLAKLNARRRTEAIKIGRNLSII